MLPQSEGLRIGKDVPVASVRDETSRTYKINFETGRVAGFVDGIEAVKQAAMMILNTERFAFAIYNRNHGVEMAEVIGKSRSLFKVEIELVIREALMQDKRITDVHSFVITPHTKRTMRVQFVIDTIFGSAQMQREVENIE